MLIEYLAEEVKVGRLDRIGYSIRQPAYRQLDYTVAKVNELNHTKSKQLSGFKRHHLFLIVKTEFYLNLQYLIYFH